MKIKDKVRRKHYDWFRIMKAFAHPDVEKHFIELSSKLNHGKCLSKNRCAYNALKSFYSTTSQFDLLRKLGL